MPQFKNIKEFLSQYKVVYINDKIYAKKDIKNFTWTINAIKSEGDKVWLTFYHTIAPHELLDEEQLRRFGIIK